MSKPIVFFDTETTGLSKQFDWIIQLSAVKLDRDTLQELDRWDNYIKPAGPYEISPDATAVHGLTKEFIEKNGKPLKKVGPDFLKFVDGCDFAGYNSNQYDVLMAYKDFTHAGLNFPIEGVKFYDILAMERKIHPMNLDSVYARYTGKTMEQAGYKAHDSMSDTLATVEVFKKQMEFLDFETIDTWIENDLLTPDGTVRRASRQDEPLLIVFNQGKYRDRDVYEVMKMDSGYMKWAAEKMFSSYTLKLLRQYCKTKQAVEKNNTTAKHK